MSVARSFRCGSLRAGTELGEIGAGVQQSANATYVMHHLGVLDTLRDVAYLPPVTEFRLFDNGEVLQALSLAERSRGLPRRPLICRCIAPTFTEFCYNA